METTKNATRKNTIVVDSSLDWIGRMFRPEVYELWKKDKEGYYVSTLTLYRYNFEKSFPGLPATKVAELKKAIDSFLKTQKSFNEAKILGTRMFYDYSMREKSRIIFNKTSELLTCYN